MISIALKAPGKKLYLAFIRLGAIERNNAAINPTLEPKKRLINEKVNNIKMIWIKAIMNWEDLIDNPHRDIIWTNKI